MRSLSLRLFIAVLAVAVASNGMMLRVASAAPVAHMAHAAAFAGADSTNAHSHGGHAGHHKHVGHHKTADRLPVAAHDHADTGAKCCSMCLVVAHALPAFSSSPVTFTYAAVQFAVAKQTLADHLVPLDPDIPKSLL